MRRVAVLFVSSRAGMSPPESAENSRVCHPGVGFQVALNERDALAPNHERPKLCKRTPSTTNDTLNGLQTQTAAIACTTAVKFRGTPTVGAPENARSDADSKRSGSMSCIVSTAHPLAAVAGSTITPCEPTSAFEGVLSSLAGAGKV